MQGIHKFIPTEDKVRYVQHLLGVGFDTLDMGSFVSPKVIPQMRDTEHLIKKLDLSKSNSKLLVIIANVKGAEIAHQFEEIDYLGFPFSISEVFQKRNTNAGIEESLKRVDAIRNLCEKSGKELVVYISMAFGNPYNDKWNVDIVDHWVRVMSEMDIRIVSLADTIGSSTVESIEYLMGNLIKAYPSIEFGAHIHSRPDEWRDKIDAAYKNGCRRFDGAIRGFGGCPMAADKLIGNMPTENLIQYFREVKEDLNLNESHFFQASEMSLEIFPG
ncbi:MAG TPA: hydroxymethylglutaryl-CoA lyase [Flavobacteriales bacterium]|nr:hydroxymethylglutaryl-CoA lyase [Flavobacteriales bacterium]